jgi:hypothetical protein
VLCPCKVKGSSVYNMGRDTADEDASYELEAVKAVVVDTISEY